MLMLPDKLHSTREKTPSWIKRALLPKPLPGALPPDRIAKKNRKLKIIRGRKITL